MVELPPEGNELLRLHFADLKSGESRTIKVAPTFRVFGPTVWVKQWHPVTDMVVLPWYDHSNRAGLAIIDGKSGEFRSVAGMLSAEWRLPKASWSPSGSWVAAWRAKYGFDGEDDVSRVLLIPAGGGEPEVLFERAAPDSAFSLDVEWDKALDVLIVLWKPKLAAEPRELMIFDIGGDGCVGSKRYALQPDSIAVRVDDVVVAIGQGKFVVIGSPTKPETEADWGDSLWVLQVEPETSARRLHTGGRWGLYRDFEWTGGGEILTILRDWERGDGQDGGEKKVDRFLRIDLESGEATEVLPPRGECWGTYGTGPDGTHVYWGDAREGAIFRSALGEWKPEVVYRVPDGSEPAERGE